MWGGLRLYFEDRINDATPPAINILEFLWSDGFRAPSRRAGNTAAFAADIAATPASIDTCHRRTSSVHGNARVDMRENRILDRTLFVSILSVSESQSPTLRLGSKLLVTGERHSEFEIDEGE